MAGSLLVYHFKTLLELDFIVSGLRDDVVHRARASIEPSIFKSEKPNACTYGVCDKSTEHGSLERASEQRPPILIQGGALWSVKGKAGFLE